MSSYFPSFNYMGQNSLKDKNLIVVHFESGDTGETETFLGMDSVYTENAYGTRRIDYGARYNSVALIRISVMKKDEESFSVTEVRDFLKWTTGVKKTSFLDLVNEDTVAYSFCGRVINVLQHKLDQKTVGFTIEFESVSPWAYSPEQTISGPTQGALAIDDNGLLYICGETDEDKLSLYYNTGNGSISVNNTTNGGLTYFDDGIVAVSACNITINNLTDDLYNYVYLNVKFVNKDSKSLEIENTTLNEMTQITGLKKNEVVEISSEHFIVSDSPQKIFGDSFNFVWPRLAPGINEFKIYSDKQGHIYISYRYPIKIGDCAIDM